VRKEASRAQTPPSSEISSVISSVERSNAICEDIGGSILWDEFNGSQSVMESAFAPVAPAVTEKRLRKDAKTGAACVKRTG